MTRRELLRCILYTAIIPIVVLGNSIRVTYLEIKQEHISDKEILNNLIEPVSEGLALVPLILLIFSSMTVLVFEYIKGDDRVDRLLRYRDRDSYTRSLIVDGLKYSLCVVMIMEILKILSLILFLGLRIMASKEVLVYIFLDTFMCFLFYFRVISVYLLCKTEFSNRIVSIITTVFIYFVEYIIFYYVLYETEWLPAYTLMISFDTVFRGVNPVMAVVWFCVSLIIDVILALLLIIKMRGKDILSFEK